LYSTRLTPIYIPFTFLYYIFLFAFFIFCSLKTFFFLFAFSKFFQHSFLILPWYSLQTKRDTVLSPDLFIVTNISINFFESVIICIGCSFKFLLEVGVENLNEHLILSIFLCFQIKIQSYDITDSNWYIIVIIIIK
jgi:hypothetical protein